ncbi:NAD-glutamate dehydrogenase domain-containing protein [Ehrlichia ruminantium]|uniref:NAD-glutamate dehydrogenase domain-containing protein n=1 Tax=Ehrlichia ruminantium TaxID=779 RepID=UPI0009BEE54F
MLLSDKIHLVGAFDHKNIFIDPSPNPEQSFLERKRLFHLPGSSWEDYNKDHISKGGKGVYVLRSFVQD